MQEICPFGCVLLIYLVVPISAGFSSTAAFTTCLALQKHFYCSISFPQINPLYPKKQKAVHFYCALFISSYRSIIPRKKKQKSKSRNNYVPPLYP
uniref:Secreted protein n=2 Tax=Aegilops tauschii subsp. strangulata TaxID=200361 RepID=A0A452ZTD7_AEGTS